ncbi:MAG: hypothetical protein ACRD2C_00370 [Acidimicrobiales bacterium]
MTSFSVDAPPEVWAAITDPARLAAIVPGCQSVTRDTGGATGLRRDGAQGDEPARGGRAPEVVGGAGGRGGGEDAGRSGGPLHIVADLAVASVRGLWTGTVAGVDADAVRVTGSGAPGTVDVVVRADPERTMLTVEGTVTGALATVGSTVLAAAIRRMALDVLAAAAASDPAAPAVEDRRSGADGRSPTSPAASGATASTSPGRSSGRLVVIGAAVVGAVIVARRRRSHRAGR